jgi:hypothetical protein
MGWADTALACGVRFARGPVRLSAGLRELESRFTDEQYLAKLCELAAVDRVATGGDSMSDMTGLAARMQAGMLMFSGRGGLQSQSGGRFDALFARLAYAAARSFGWTRCGAHLLARANRMAPLHDERGAQVVAVELFAGLARASRRWPTAERAPAREQLTAFLRQHCVLGFSSGDGLDLGVEIAAALRFVANRVDARRVAWLAPRVARRLGARAGGRQRECAGARARPGVDAGAHARLAQSVVVRAHRGDLAARHRQPGAAALLAGARFDGPPRRRDAAVATGRRARAVHCRARRRAVGGARAAARHRARRRDALAGVCRRAAAHRADSARRAARQRPRARADGATHRRAACTVRHVGCARRRAARHAAHARRDQRRGSRAADAAACSRFATALRCGASTRRCSRLRARHCSTRASRCAKAPKA